MKENNEKEDSGKFKILLESVKSKFDFVSEADNCLDKKAGVLMGIEFAIIIGYSSLFTVNNFEKLQIYFSTFGLILLSISIILLIIVIKPKERATISVNIFEHKEYWEKSETDLLRQLIADAQSAFTINNKILKERARLLQHAIYLLAYSCIPIMLSLTYSTFWV